jgi:hypothetical protein
MNDQKQRLEMLKETRIALAQIDLPPTIKEALERAISKSDIDGIQAACELALRQRVFETRHAEAISNWISVCQSIASRVQTKLNQSLGLLEEQIFNDLINGGKPAS